MKVILAGYSKTGTKTINAALTLLGYEVYDFMDHFWYHEKEWIKIFGEGGTIEDFKQMYKDVDAVVDVPTYQFWEEIAEAFPQAKIIFSTRDENSWVESLVKQIEDFTKPTILKTIFFLLCPTARRLYHFVNMYHPLFFVNRFTILNGSCLNKRLMKKRLREHKAYIMQNASKNRLLVYNVSEGWNPLCKFLEKEIPKASFPWLNKGGSAIMPMLRRHPCAKQMKNEVLLSICVLVMIFVFLICFI